MNMMNTNDEEELLKMMVVDHELRSEKKVCLVISIC
jgi:hypothetical protein